MPWFFRLDSAPSLVHQCVPADDQVILFKIWGTTKFICETVYDKKKFSTDNQSLKKVYKRIKQTMDLQYLGCASCFSLGSGRCTDEQSTEAFSATATSFLWSMFSGFLKKENISLAQTRLCFIWSISRSSLHLLKIFIIQIQWYMCSKFNNMHV